MSVNINKSEVEEGERDNFNVLTSLFTVFQYFVLSKYSGEFEV